MMSVPSNIVSLLFATPVVPGAAAIDPVSKDWDPIVMAVIGNPASSWAPVIVNGPVPESVMLPSPTLGRATSALRMFSRMVAAVAEYVIADVSYPPYFRVNVPEFGGPVKVNTYVAVAIAAVMSARIVPRLTVRFGAKFAPVDSALPNAGCSSS